MVARGQTPPNVRTDIDDSAPNPSRPLSTPSQPPRLKPWEAKPRGSNASSASITSSASRQVGTFPPDLVQRPTDAPLSASSTRLGAPTQALSSAPPTPYMSPYSGADTPSWHGPSDSPLSGNDSMRGLPDTAPQQQQHRAPSAQGFGYQPPLKLPDSTARQDNGATAAPGNASDAAGSSNKAAYALAVPPASSSWRPPLPPTPSVLNFLKQTTGETNQQAPSPAGTQDRVTGTGAASAVAAGSVTNGSGAGISGSHEDAAPQLNPMAATFTPAFATAEDSNDTARKELPADDLGEATAGNDGGLAVGSHSQMSQPSEYGDSAAQQT